MSLGKKRGVRGAAAPLYFARRAATGHDTAMAAAGAVDLRSTTRIGGVKRARPAGGGGPCAHEDGCAQPAAVGGLCSSHYRKRRRMEQALTRCCAGDTPRAIASALNAAAEASTLTTTVMTPTPLHGDECRRVVFASGMCRRHYDEYRRDAAAARARQRALVRCMHRRDVVAFGDDGGGGNTPRHGEFVPYEVCGAPVRCAGLCGRHYKQRWRAVAAQMRARTTVEQ